MHTGSQLAARWQESHLISINFVGFEPGSWKAPHLTANLGWVPSLLLSFLWRLRFHSHKSGQAPPPAPAKLNQPTWMMSTNLTLQIFEMQCLSRHLEVISPRTRVAKPPTPASSRKRTSNIAMILNSQLSVTAHTTLQFKSHESKVC